MSLKALLVASALVSLCAGAAAAQTTTAKSPATPTPSATANVKAAGGKVVPAGDIVATAKASGQFTILLKAAEATNLTGLLRDTQNLTVFAPTDAAFAALPAGELDKLMLPENKAALQKLLIYHLVNARVDSAKFKGAKGPVQTVAGTSVELNGAGDYLMVNDADITQSDVVASNGLIHVIDKVLMPTGAMAASQSSAPASATTSQ